MTIPGIKFRGSGGNRWITPQLHESLFRLGLGSFSGGTVNESTVVTGVGSILATSLTLSSFQVPANAAHAALIVCVSTRDVGDGVTVTGVTWNSHALTELIEAVHADGHTASMHRWNIVAGDLGATSNIVVTFSAASFSSLACAYVIENVSTDAPEDEGVATVSNVATVAIPLSLAATNDLVLDWFTHVYAVPVDPSPSGTGQTEIAGAQATDGGDMRGEGSKISASVAGSTTMSWAGLDATTSATVQIALAFKKYVFVPPTQPVTAKLAVGYDFSGIDSTVTVTGQGISNVTDSSGNSNAGVQATDNNRLVYDGTMVNGRFVGVQNTLIRFLSFPASITNWTGNGQPNYHVLCVVQITTWTNNAKVWTFETGGAAPRNALWLSTTGGTRFQARFPTDVPGSTTVLSTETALATDTTYLVEQYVNGSGGAALTVNGGTPATSTSQESTGESLTVRRVGNSSASAPMKICAVYIFNDVLTAGELADWRTFLKYRWGYV